jgi:hypothetical protein
MWRPPGPGLSRAAWVRRHETTDTDESEFRPAKVLNYPAVSVITRTSHCAVL